MVLVISSRLSYQEDIRRVILQDLGLAATMFQETLPHYAHLLRTIHTLAHAPDTRHSVMVVRGIHQSGQVNDGSQGIDPTWYWFNVRLIQNHQPLGHEYHVYVYHVGHQGLEVVPMDARGNPTVAETQGYWQFATLLDS